MCRGLCRGRRLRLQSFRVGELLGTLSTHTVRIDCPEEGEGLARFDSHPRRIKADTEY